MILTIRLDRTYGHCYQLADAPVNNFVYRSLTKIIREYILNLPLLTFFKNMVQVQVR